MLSPHSSCGLCRQPQLLPQNLHDLRVGFRRGATGVDYNDTLRLAGGNRQVSMAHTPEESTVFPLETVFIAFYPAIVSGSSSVATAGAFHAGSDVGVHKNG